MKTKRRKTGGRTTGTPNRSSLEAIEIFGKNDFCPLDKVIERLGKPGISDELYTSTCLKLLEFKFPKRKAIEITQDLKAAETNDLIKEAKEIIASLEE